MSTTPLGKFLRKLRVDKDERLYDMARQVGVSSAFLSGVENGHKKASDSLINKLIDAYHLTPTQQKDLKDARSQSIEQLDLSSFSPRKQKATLMFARKFDYLSEEEIQKINRILRGDNKDDEL